MAGNRVQPECGMRCKGFRADAVRNRRRVLAAALSMDRIAPGGRQRCDAVPALRRPSGAVGRRRGRYCCHGVGCRPTGAGSDPFAALRGVLQVLARERLAALSCLPDRAAGKGRRLGRWQRGGRRIPRMDLGREKRMFVLKFFGGHSRLGA